MTTRLWVPGEGRNPSARAFLEGGLKLGGRGGASAEEAGLVREEVRC